MAYSKKSPWVIHYDGSSCNGCDIEVLAALCPGFDAERFGVINTGNPKHADIFLVTGSVNEQNKGIIKQIYDQMLEPKVVVACGICACTGGVFKDCYNILGGVDKAIPVDVYVPGCAVRPESLIDAVVAGIEALDAKSKALKKERKANKGKKKTSIESKAKDEGSFSQDNDKVDDKKSDYDKKIKPSDTNDNKSNEDAKEDKLRKSKHHNDSKNDTEKEA